MIVLLFVLLALCVDVACVVYVICVACVVMLSMSLYLLASSGPAGCAGAS